MPTENVQQFNLQVLRAMVVLYKAFPTPLMLDHAALRAPQPAQSGAEYGTILWLHGNGYVQGALMRSEPLSGEPVAAIGGAQLSPKSLRVLNSVDNNLGGEVGKLIVANIGGPRENVYADRLAYLLLNN